LFEDFGLTRFSEFTRQKHLVNDGVDFVEIEHKVELTYVFEIFVQNLDKVMNGFKIEEIVVGDIDANAKIETRVASVDDLEVPELDKVCVLRIADSD